MEDKNFDKNSKRSPSILAMDFGGENELKDSITWDMDNLDQLHPQRYIGEEQLDIMVSTPIPSNFLGEEEFMPTDMMLPELMSDVNFHESEEQTVKDLLELKGEDQNATIVDSTNLLDPKGEQLIDLKPVSKEVEALTIVDETNLLDPKGEEPTDLKYVLKEVDAVTIVDWKAEVTETVTIVDAVPLSTIFLEKEAEEATINVDATRQEVTSADISTNFPEKKEGSPSHLENAAIAEAVSNSTSQPETKADLTIANAPTSISTDRKEDTELPIAVTPISVKVPRKRKEKTLPEDIMKNWIVKYTNGKDGRVDKSYKHKILNFTCRSLIEVSTYETIGVRPQQRRKLQIRNQPLEELNFQYGEHSNANANGKANANANAKDKAKANANAKAKAEAKAKAKSDSQDSTTLTDPNCYAIAKDSGEEVEKLTRISDDTQNFHIQCREPSTTPNADGEENPTKKKRKITTATGTKLVNVPIINESNIDELLKEAPKDTSNDAGSSNFQAQVFAELNALKTSMKNLQDNMSMGFASILDMFQNKMSGTLQFSFKEK